jgi:hypothetical protein
MNQNGQLIEQVIFTNKDFVQIAINDKTLLFVKSEKCIYSVNKTFNTLQKVPHDDIVNNIKSVRSLFGKITFEPYNSSDKINELFGYKQRSFELSNNSDFKLSGQLSLVLLPGLFDTAFKEYIEFDRRNQPFEFPINEDEITANLSINISTPMGNQSQYIELISVERIDSCIEIDEISKYTIMN